MKFAPAKKIRDFSWSEPSPAWIPHEIFENWHFPKICCPGITRSKMLTGTWGPDQNEAQTTPGVEQILPEQTNYWNPEHLQSKVVQRHHFLTARRGQIAHCRRITLRANALQVTWNTNRGATKQWNSRQRKKIVSCHGLNPHQLEYFMKFSKIDIFKKPRGPV